jgi:hypothetical protein
MTRKGKAMAGSVESFVFQGNPAFGLIGLINI